MGWLGDGSRRAGSPSLNGGGQGLGKHFEVGWAKSQGACESGVSFANRVWGVSPTYWSRDIFGGGGNQTYRNSIFAALSELRSKLLSLLLVGYSSRGAGKKRQGGTSPPKLPRWKMFSLSSMEFVTFDQIFSILLGVSGGFNSDPTRGSVPVWIPPLVTEPCFAPLRNKFLATPLYSRRHNDIISITVLSATRKLCYRKARYRSISWGVEEILLFEIIQDGGGRHLEFIRIENSAIRSAVSEKTHPKTKHDVDRATGCGDIPNIAVATILDLFES